MHPPLYRLNARNPADACVDCGLYCLDDAMSDTKRWQEDMARRVEQANFITFTFTDGGRYVTKVPPERRKVIAAAIRAISDEKK